MIQLVEILPTELYAMVNVAYKDDYDLFNDYNIRSFDTITDAIGSTLYLVAETSKEKTLKYYRVNFNNDPIGYMVTCENKIFHFGINIQRRVTAILIEWIEQVGVLFNSDLVFISLYSNNKKQIQFLKDNGILIVEENKDRNYLTLLNEYSCQS